MATISIYVDPDGSSSIGGHVFVGLTDNNGNTKYYGYYPKDTIDSVYGEGIVLDEKLKDKEDETTRVETAKQSGPIAENYLTDDQYNDINNYIQDRIENPGDYFLAGEIGEQTDNCATFIGDVLDAGGIDNGFGNVPNWFEDDKKFYDMYGDNYDGIGSDNRSTIPSFESYNSQQSQQIIIDPLALDLNHNGKIDTTNANSSKAFFDMDNNGMSEITGWIDKEDGLLVYDKNNNGKIDNINELFGNKNKDGYSELRELINSNGDNVIDKNDTKFKDLKIWQDLNGDGISQNNELKTLDELNITSINLNSKNTNIDDNGNNIFKTSTFTQNGQEYLSGDVNFAVDKRFTDFRGDYSLMDEDFKKFTQTLVNDEQKAYGEFDTYLKK